MCPYKTVEKANGASAAAVAFQIAFDDRLLANDSPDEASLSKHCTVVCMPLRLSLSLSFIVYSSSSFQGVAQAEEEEMKRW